jgi:hypothetical protein
MHEWTGIALMLGGLAVFFGSMAWAVVGGIRVLAKQPEQFERQWMLHYYPRLGWLTLLGMLLFGVGQTVRHF